MTQAVQEQIKLFDLATQLSQCEAQVNQTEETIQELKANHLNAVSTLLTDFESQTPLEHNGHVYVLAKHNHPVNITLFEEICVTIGGYLVEFDDAQEYDAVVNWLNPLVSHSYFVMIGYTDEGTEGVWRYIHSGKPVTYTRWNPGRPRGGEKENCAQIWTASGAGGWLMYDYFCSYHVGYPFICELE